MLIHVDGSQIRVSMMTMLKGWLLSMATIAAGGSDHLRAGFGGRHLSAKVYHR